MDFLNKAFAQLNDLFRSMSPGGRITAGLLLVVAVVSIGYLFQAQVGGGDAYLFGGTSIPRATLDKMEEAFGKAGLNGFMIEPDGVGGRIKVPHSQRAVYLATLADAGKLPPSFDDFNDDPGGGYAELPSQAAERRKQRKEQALALTIKAMKGIERAKVLIGDPQVQRGLGEAPSTTASVFAAAVGGEMLSDDQVQNICELVGAAIGGVGPENVAVSDANGATRFGRPRTANAADDDYDRAQRKAEQNLNTKIRDILREIPGVTVSSSVALDREKSSRTVEVKNDPTKAPVKTMDYSRPVYHDSSTIGGVPGVGSQGGINQPANIASGKSGGESGEETKNEVQNVVSTISTEKESDGRATKSARASVGIPASYFERVWRTRNSTKDAEDVKKPENQTAIDEIRKAIMQDVRTRVAPLLPATDVKDPTELVTVTSLPDLKPPEIPAPAVPQRALTWLGENWPMLAMIALVLVSVGMLRSALRSAPVTASAGNLPGGSAAIAARISAGEAKTEPKEEAVESTVARRLRRMTGSGPSLRDELSDLVKEDPDSAASILRTWIGQVN